MTMTRLNKWMPWLVLLAVAALYLFTLDRGLRPEELTGGDLITHQYAQVQARPGNAPGYPLYTMLGWLWFRVGRLLFGWVLNPIQILSLYSALWGLASIWVLYQLLYRPEVSRRNALLAGLLSLFYAVSYFFWYYSVTTEQYTSAILQTLLIVWLAFKWEEDPKNSTLLWMAFISGTMLANMLTTLFILPPLLYLIFTHKPKILTQPKLIVQAILAGLAPIITYGFIYIRGAQRPEWRGEGNWASTAEWFWQFVSTQQGRDELAPGLSLQNLITPEFPSLVWGELTWLVLIGGLLGWALMGKRKAIFFFSTALIYLFFATAYRFGNWFQVVLPLYPLIVLGFGRSVAKLWLLSPSPVPGEGLGVGAKQFLRPFIVLILVALIGYRLIASINSLEAIGKHNTSADTALDPGWAILHDVTTPGWEISASFEEWLALSYLSEIWQAEPIIVLADPGAEAEYISRQGIATSPQNFNNSHPQAVGATLIYVADKPLNNLPSSAMPVKVAFANQLSLLGYKYHPQKGLITLYWQAQTSLKTDYTVSTRLWQNGQLIQDKNGPLIQDHQPVWGQYPTSRWQIDEIVVDAYTFNIPANTKPSQIQIVVYNQTETGFENLDDTVIDLQN